MKSHQSDIVYAISVQYLLREKYQKFESHDVIFVATGVLWVQFDHSKRSRLVDERSGINQRVGKWGLNNLQWNKNEQGYMDVFGTCR